MTSVVEPKLGYQDEAGRVIRREPASLFRVLVVAVFGVLIGLTACGEGDTTDATEVAVEFQGRTMGTTWSLKIPVGALPKDRHAEFQAEIEAALVAFNADFSTWIETSSLSRFNAAKEGATMKVPAPLAECLRTAFVIRQASRGAFDPSVGPIVDLWGFGPGGKPRAIPEAAALAEARERTGPAAVRLLDDGDGTPRLEKRRAGARLDLSAIAKGRGVDVLVRLAETRGLASVFVNIGGEIRARGEKAPGAPWRVAVERPSGGRQVAQQVFALRDRAIATSGDYRNYFEEGGRRYSHTIDPRTARPIEHRLAQVSVIADDCERADAWATALNVLGPEEGFELAVDQGLAALFLVRGEDGGFGEKATPAFEKLVPAAPGR